MFKLASAGLAVIVAILIVAAGLFVLLIDVPFWTAIGINMLGFVITYVLVTLGTIIAMVLDEVEIR